MRWLEPVFQKVLVNLQRRLKACHKSGEMMPISHALRAVSVDVVTAYCFGQSIENLSRENYDRPFQDAGHSFIGVSAWFIHWPWLSPLMSALPNSILFTLMPRFDDWLQLENETLRLYPTFVTRMQRVSLDEPMFFDSRVGNNAPWACPAGRCVSMQVRLIHMNPSIFSELGESWPERWLDNPRLDRHLLAF